MIRSETPRWLRSCLAIPCLAAALCLTQVGCGGGTDDAGGDGGAAAADDGSGDETDGSATE